MLRLADELQQSDPWDSPTGELSAVRTANMDEENKTPISNRSNRKKKKAPSVQLDSVNPSPMSLGALADFIQGKAKISSARPISNYRGIAKAGTQKYNGTGVKTTR
jgi:hypothetical protein